MAEQVWMEHALIGAQSRMSIENVTGNTALVKGEEEGFAGAIICLIAQGTGTDHGTLSMTRIDIVPGHRSNRAAGLVANKCSMIFNKRVALCRMEI